ncbi:unnamed protein product [Chironomus riparius]|uniref:Uncharacterized protein n=1 Tax=Chironomus riparius TaxID=315576 RepID=A0A9N9RIS8_9DIPT|nr:unnamed protein product [Chironomus riparius]
MFSSNLTTVIPVVIGTVPIREDQFIQNTFTNPEPSSYYSPVSCTQPSASDFPPSFKEATSVPEKQNLSLMEKSMPTSIAWGM